jgi:hypothetical protein
LRDGVGDRPQEPDADGIAVAPHHEQRRHVSRILETPERADGIAPDHRIAGLGERPEGVGAQPRLLGVEHHQWLAEGLDLRSHAPSRAYDPHLLQQQHRRRQCAGDLHVTGAAGSAACRSI